MRRTIREEQPDTIRQDEIVDANQPQSTVENPVMEELHTVSSSAVPAWKTPSVVVAPTKKKDPFKSNTMFVSIDEEFAETSDRPIAPSSATILSEKEVKEHFSYSDDQLVYRPDMKFKEKAAVTFRKAAVWISDVWDKYIIFMKKHVPTVFQDHEVYRVMSFGFGILFILIALCIIGALALH
ncbi:MAG: hypothetical protein J5379_00205 [Clostridiales bacterium]|nr:hypothetical protein [Clostridiales bacterium]